jgi:hypothetical protein
VTRASLAAALLVLVVSACGDRDTSVASISDGTRALPEVPYLLRVGTHCGVEWLGMPVNDVFWITDEASGSTSDWMPVEWSQSLGAGEELIALEVVLSADESQLTATKAGRSVVYRPRRPTDPEKFCA